MSSNSNFKKKQGLISDYYHKIKSLKHQRGQINADIKMLENKFEELIDANAEIDQLELFENMDDFLSD